MTTNLRDQWIWSGAKAKSSWGLRRLGRRADLEHVRIRRLDRVARVDNELRVLRDLLIVERSMIGQDDDAIGGGERRGRQVDRRQIATGWPLARREMRDVRIVITDARAL